jgi:hypothetical protein
MKKVTFTVTVAPPDPIVTDGLELLIAVMAHTLSLIDPLPGSVIDWLDDVASARLTRAGPTVKPIGHCWVMLPYASVIRNVMLPPAMADGP